ncbi:hypothetical protein CR203_14935 [Salipaludibacillus neizhouensis]|uniref:GGDEF domain-containing protein n=1 Tax=Salipaludibacillus neizhouensis TaxID=885475 RepID=A0A3A9K6T6_9BACI|nr:diguanylate cyclase [Salipaludibacillus neizhouensis]RKL66580.1 hypothetical protein CR203_14935 [Salipaludibacillus neizhouensis]
MDFRDVTVKTVADQKLKKANQLLERLSLQDGLTGIANRRCFDDTLVREWNKRLDVSIPISLILLDIDFFKAFNDLYGHQAGDACLKQLGSFLRNITIGTEDLAARYGGEEFVMLLPDRSIDQAIDIANRIQETVRSARIPHNGSNINGEILTLSIGISTKLVTPSSQPTDMITEADAALYEAKRSGRNQIKLHG